MITRARKHAGFTLIEVMIAVAILAIVASVAYPSYTRYVVRSHREAAKSELLQLANTQEKVFLNSNSYAVSVTAAYNGRSDGGLGITSGQTSDGRYTITMTPTTGPTQTYTITATPITGSTQAADGNITVSSNGVRTWGSQNW